MMARSLWKNRLPFLAGAFALVAYFLTAILIPESWRQTLRENAFDLVLTLDQRLQPIATATSPTRVVVVDIDRPSIEKLGPWPWPRLSIAHLVEAIAVAKPRVIAMDILFAEPDARSPAALAR